MINLQYFSPEEILEDDLFLEKSVQVSIKRDDLIHPYISGNKWRKLKHTIRRAELENKRHLVTFGGAYSNHLLATACAGAKFNFQTTGIVRGEEVENDILMLCRLFGMNLIFIDRPTYLNKPLVFTNLFGNDARAFFIDEGGAGIDAFRGCAELVSELRNPYDHIFCASGTGTTAAGILKGLHESDFPATLHAVPVLKGATFIRAAIEEYFEQPPAFCIHTDYHFGGYAKTDSDLLKFMQRFSASTGILLDPVYTGKMLFAVYDLIRKDYFTPGSRILAVHTGGLLGLLGMTKKINQAIL